MANMTTETAKRKEIWAKEIKICSDLIKTSSIETISVRKEAAKLVVLEVKKTFLLEPVQMLSKKALDELKKVNYSVDSVCIALNELSSSL